jgi:hypothetical protein
MTHERRKTLLECLLGVHNLSMALQSSVGLWPLFQFLDLLHTR